MAYSSVEAVAYSSREYLKHGIWPVNPYCTPELIQFCRSLPWEWRKDRRLQREVLANAGCSRNITHPTQPEHFGHLMTRALQRAAPKVNLLFKNSQLADLGYIDPGKFLTAYNYHIAQPQASGYSDMDFYTVIAMEYSLLAVDGEVTLKAMI
jgi:asparagine synthase (glutamine-hydrolysing)